MPGRIWSKLKSTFQDIVDSIKSVINQIPFVNVGDFVSRPGQPTVSFDPNDTIVGVKDLSALKGGNTFNFYGVTQEEFLETAKRELGIETFTSSRF